MSYGAKVLEHREGVYLLELFGGYEAVTVLVEVAEDEVATAL